jgi:O-methyltransferase
MGGESFDMVFIDADKANWRAYYESSLALVRTGGLIVVDNTVFFGQVIDSDARDLDTVAVRELNAFLHGDDRVDIAMLSMADGITLVRKRAS